MAKLTCTSTSISAKRLADFISNVQEHEALLLQRLRDWEAHQVLNAFSQKPEKPVPSEMVVSSSFLGSKEPSLEQESLTKMEIELVPIFEEYR